jgi:hypothetical protein
MLQIGEKRTFEEVSGGNNSTNSENTNPYSRAIHIHRRMEHNLVWYAKYYSCAHTKISRNSEFTREINKSERDFLDIGKKML